MLLVFLDQYQWRYDTKGTSKISEGKIGFDIVNEVFDLGPQSIAKIISTEGLYTNKPLHMDVWKR